MVIWAFLSDKPSNVSYSQRPLGSAVVSEVEQQQMFILLFLFFWNCSYRMILVSVVYWCMGTLWNRGFTLPLPFCPRLLAFLSLSLPVSHSCHGEGLINMDASLWRPRCNFRKKAYTLYIYTKIFFLLFGGTIGIFSSRYVYHCCICPSYSFGNI